MFLSEERFLLGLRRRRKAIEGGKELTIGDSNHIHASWGMCAEDAFTEREDQLFPEDFDSYGRIAPKYMDYDQACPMNKDGISMGCFYSCRLFQGPVPDRGEALELYDAAIDARGGGGDSPGPDPERA